MSIKYPKFFILSLVLLGLSACQLYLANHILETTATRDFDFGQPLAIILSSVQVVLALVGAAFSVGKK